LALVKTTAVGLLESICGASDLGLQNDTRTNIQQACKHSGKDLNLASKDERVARSVQAREG
jgi:hypothetical protein